MSYSGIAKRRRKCSGGRRTARRTRVPSLKPWLEERQDKTDAKKWFTVVCGGNVVLKWNEEHTILIAPEKTAKVRTAINKAAVKYFHNFFVEEHESGYWFIHYHTKKRSGYSYTPNKVVHFKNRELKLSFSKEH